MPASILLSAAAKGTLLRPVCGPYTGRSIGGTDVNALVMFDRATRQKTTALRADHNLENLATQRLASPCTLCLLARNKFSWSEYILPVLPAGCRGFEEVMLRKTHVAEPYAYDIIAVIATGRYIPRFPSHSKRSFPHMIYAESYICCYPCPASPFRLPSTSHPA